MDVFLNNELVGSKDNIVPYINTSDGITTGADNGSFITAIGFENMQAYGKMDDMWNAPNSGMDQLVDKNLNQIDLI